METLRKITQIQTRKWLSSEYGMELMLHLRENVPSVGRGDVHQMVFDAGVAEGYKIALNRISEITPREEASEQRADNP
jgi:hypothetical protein